MFSLDVQGKVTRQTPIQQRPVYPVTCVGTIERIVPVTALIYEQGIGPCGYDGNLNGIDTERLLEQVARRTGNPAV